MIFHLNDLVHISKDLGKTMRHFPSGRRGIVVGSNADDVGVGEHNQYTIWVEDGCATSWYESHQLTLIESNRSDLLMDWRKLREIKRQKDPR